MTNSTSTPVNTLPFAPVASTALVGEISSDQYAQAGRHFASMMLYRRHGNALMQEVAEDCGAKAARIAEEAESAVFRIARERG